MSIIKLTLPLVSLICGFAGAASAHDTWLIANRMEAAPGDERPRRPAQSRRRREDIT